MALSTLIVLALAVCAVHCMSTTHAPHMHHGKPETESFSFYYEGTTSAMLVTSEHNCYIWDLTADEKSMIHTDEGLRSVELRVMNDIGSALYTVVPQFILHPNIVRSCTRADRQSSSFFLVH